MNLFNLLLVIVDIDIIIIFIVNVIIDIDIIIIVNIIIVYNNIITIIREVISKCLSKETHAAECTWPMACGHSHVVRRAHRRPRL